VKTSLTDFTPTVVFRITMKTSRSFSACLLALLALPALAFSQDVKKDTPAADDAKPHYIDKLDIKNATYGEVADMLRKETGLNIMVAPGLQDEMAPTIMLRHVTVDGVLDAICAVTGLIQGESRQDDTVIRNLMPDNIGAPDTPMPKPKICRVFKASAKEKLAPPQLDQLLANISDAARKVCEVEARAKGRPAAEAPVIEAHAGTGIVIVAGTESDVQLVGQVIQAMGGEVVPLTSSVSAGNPVGTIEITSGKGSQVGTIEVTGVTLNRGTSSSDPGAVVAKDMENTRKDLELAREQVKKLEKQLEQLGQQTPHTTPPPPKPNF
jgi:hypothetical protein